MVPGGERSLPLLHHLDLASYGLMSPSRHRASRVVAHSVFAAWAGLAPTWLQVAEWSWETNGRLVMRCSMHLRIKGDDWAPWVKCQAPPAPEQHLPAHETFKRHMQKRLQVASEGPRRLWGPSGPMVHAVPPLSTSPWCPTPPTSLVIKSSGQDPKT